MVSTDPGPQSAPEPTRRRPPSIAVGMSLLGLAAVLIVVVLVNPTMTGWLRVVVAVLAILVVLTLLGYAVVLWRSMQRGGGR